MRRRLLLCALALVVFVPPAFAKRRAVTPGAPGHCITGRIARFATPTSMTRDATHLYWSGSFFDGLARAPLLGGPTQSIADVDQWTVQTMTADDTTIYMGALPNGSSIQPGVILSVPKTGGIVTVLASGVPLPYDIEVDATHVYWAAVGTPASGSIVDGKIERALKNGTGRETLIGGNAPMSIELDGDRLWFGESGFASEEKIGLYTMPKSGGARTTIRGDVAVGSIVFSGDSVLVYGATETVSTGLFVIAKDGSSMRTLVEEEDISGEQRIVAGRVFYTTVPGLFGERRLWSVPLSGDAEPALVREGLDSFLDELEVDGCAVIISTENGELVRVKG